MLYCELCGKGFINLHAHLLHNHKIGPAEYRDIFGVKDLTERYIVPAQTKEESIYNEYMHVRYSKKQR